MKGTLITPAVTAIITCLPSLHRPKSAILTNPSASISRLSSFRSLGEQRGEHTGRFRSAMFPDELTCKWFCSGAETRGRGARRTSRTWKQRTWEHEPNLEEVSSGQRSDADRACFSVKMLVWMWVIRSPPGEYAITKHTCSSVWKQPCRLTRKGWREALMTSKILFSQTRLSTNTRWDYRNDSSSLMSSW